MKGASRCRQDANTVFHVGHKLVEAAADKEGKGGHGEVELHDIESACGSPGPGSVSTVTARRAQV